MIRESGAAPPPAMSRRRWLPWLGVTIALVLGAGLVARWVDQGTVVMLIAEDGARWIRQAEVPTAVAKWSENQSRSFRVHVEIATPPSRAVLRVKALRHWGVFVNAERVVREPAPGPAWVRADVVDLAPWLRAGDNEIIVTVDNDMGPPALHAVSEDLGLASDERWEVLAGDGPWEPAVGVTPRAPFPLSRAFPSAPRSLESVLPLWLGLFALGAVLVALARGRELLRADQLRWALLLGFAVLCAHNIDRLEIGLGFDSRRHYEYIAYVAQNARVPLATDGWQMFQAPLFYLITAPLYLGLHEVMEQPNVLIALRVIPMLCGLAQIELCFRAARIAFPGRNDLQLLATAVGGLMPMNLYSNQFVSNEPLAAMLSSWMIVVALRALVAPDRDALPRTALWLGLLFGLTALAKVTVLVLSPLIAGLIVWHGHRSRAGAGETASALAVFAGTSLFVAGWYYLRNWIELGAPFVGGWDPARGLAWWQVPAFREPWDVLRFGQALVHPIYSSYQGFWDGFYSSVWLDGHLSAAANLSVAPPWGYRFMLSLALLSLPLSLALAGGVARALRGPTSGEDLPTHRAVVFSALALGLIVAAMLAIYLRVPSFSSVKGSYALGLLPCFALLIAWGADPLLRGTVGRALVCGFVLAWAAFSFLAFVGA